MNKLHLVQYIRFSSDRDLLPTHIIESGDSPFDYAIMTPDYKWHYYAQYEKDDRQFWKPVTITGGDISE